MRRKYNIEPRAFVKYITDTGEIPPKNASCVGPNGYWYLAAQALSGKSHPSFKFVTAVASYWYHNRADVCSSVYKIIGLGHYQVGLCSSSTGSLYGANCMPILLFVHIPKRILFSTYHQN